MIKNIVLAVALLLPLSACSLAPAFAQVCLTKTDVTQQVVNYAPDSVIVYEDADTLVFQSPTIPDFLSIGFDDNGCFESYAVIDKSAFDLMYVGV